MRPLNRLQGLQSFGLGIAAVVFIVASPSARAEIPGASDPKAFTSRDAREQEYEFNRRTLVEEYEKVGHRDPRWDKQAEQLLELEAIYFTQGGLSVKQPFAKRATVAELYAAADAATAAGCDDPLVLDAFCVACHDRQAFDEWKHWSTTAVNGMLASRYPAWRKANAARRSLGLLDRQKDAMRWTKIEDAVFDLDVEMCRQKTWQSADRRWCYKVIRDDIESWPTSKLQNFLTELAAQPADDWMVAMCSGKAHVKIGWNARGGGTIDTVTPQGMTILRAEMGEARKCLAAAGKFHPDYPEAATEMINVVLGEGGGAEECRACFDRAVRAELDYHPAYGALLYAYLPRWVGNYESMYNFGLECAETKRYDTCIPHILADVLADIHDDGQGWSFLSNPKVFQPLQEMYEGLIANASGDERFRYASEFLGFAWQSNRWDDGRRVLDQIEGKVDRTGMAVPAKVIADRAVSGMYVLTGTNAMASGAMAAEKLAAGRRFAEAATQYESLRDGLNVAPRELVWLRGRAQELHWQEQFDRGDWVDLTPDANLSGWYVQAGTFTSSGRELSGTTAENGAMLICGFKPGTRWELHATFQIEKPTERWQR